MFGKRHIVHASLLILVRRKMLSPASAMCTRIPQTPRNWGPSWRLIRWWLTWCRRWRRKCWNLSTCWRRWLFNGFKICYLCMAVWRIRDNDVKNLSMDKIELDLNNKILVRVHPIFLSSQTRIRFTGRRLLVVYKSVFWQVVRNLAASGDTDSLPYVPSKEVLRARTRR